METRQCKKCRASFEPEFSSQVNCAKCKEDAKARTQKSRMKQEAAQEAKRIPTYCEYQESVPQAQRTALSNSVREYTTKIRYELAELGGRGLTGDDEYVI